MVTVVVMIRWLDDDEEDDVVDNENRKKKDRAREVSPRRMLYTKVM